MLKDSLSGTPKAMVSGRRPLVMVLLAGACCMALGLFGFQVAEQQPISNVAMDSHVTSLTEHHSYLESQN